jgi:hypothetical protein
VAALSGTPDAFSIVLLSTLGRGQSIAATDMGWLPEAEAFYSSGYNPETASVVHTASDDEPPGRVLTQADFSGGTLSLDGRDQLLVYQGSLRNPTFLCAFDWSGYDWQTSDWSYSGTYYSGLPRGLTSGVDALNTKTLGWSSSYYYYNSVYRGNGSAHISGLRIAIATGSNWQYSNSRSSVASLVKTSFTVLPPPPSLPPLPPPLPPAPPQPPNDPPLPPLVPGDCMVVAALSGTPDAFSIVLLSTLGRGQSIAATDMGWLPEVQEFNQYSRSYYSNGPETTSVVHTASDDEPPGTVLTSADFIRGPLSLGTQDQLLIYQGTHDNPTFLCAFDWSTHDWKSTDWLDTELSSYSYSGLPRGLTSGVDALNPRTLGWSSLYSSNWVYRGTDTASINELRTAIATDSNWETNLYSSPTIAALVKTSFTVLPPPPSPTPPSPSSPEPSPPPPPSPAPSEPSTPPPSPLQPTHPRCTPLPMSLPSPPPPPPSKPSPPPPPPLRSSLPPRRDPLPPPLEESTGHVERGGDEDSSQALPLVGAVALLLAVLLFRRAKR